MYKNVKCILFDLGGVLVELVGFPKILKLMDNRVDKDELIRMWLFSPCIRKFESGKLATEEFAQLFIEEFGLCIDAGQFIKDYTYFTSGLHEGVKELIEKLQKEYKVACLSNTNELHWNRLCREECLEELIPLSFPSHKTGYMKPDKEAYLNVVNKLKCKPDEILFLDDNQINVNAAIDAGMNAIRVRDFDDLKQKLKEIGIISLD